jgi:microsomal epoxide hydrolase
LPEPANVDSSSIDDLERKGLERTEWFKTVGSAYALEHATRPSTVGFVLASNPLALLAWYVIREFLLDMLSINF